MEVPYKHNAIIEFYSCRTSFVVTCALTLEATLLAMQPFVPAYQMTRASNCKAHSYMDNNFHDVVICQHTILVYL